VNSFVKMLLSKKTGGETVIREGKLLKILGNPKSGPAALELECMELPSASRFYLPERENTRRPSPDDLWDGHQGNRIEMHQNRPVPTVPESTTRHDALATKRGGDEHVHVLG